MSPHSASLNRPAAKLRDVQKTALAALPLPLGLLLACLHYMAALLSPFGVHHIRCVFLSAGGGVTLRTPDSVEGPQSGWGWGSAQLCGVWRGGGQLDGVEKPLMFGGKGGQTHPWRPAEASGRSIQHTEATSSIPMPPGAPRGKKP